MQSCDDGVRTVADQKVRGQNTFVIMRDSKVAENTTHCPRVLAIGLGLKISSHNHGHIGDNHTVVTYTIMKSRPLSGGLLAQALVFLIALIGTEAASTQSRLQGTTFDRSPY